MPTLPSLSEFTGSGVTQDQFKAAFSQLHEIVASLFAGYTGATSAFVNPATLSSASFSVPAGYNAVTAGPVSIDEGSVIDIGNNANWTIV